ncbi:WD40 repeat domain-containing protein [Kibdelosporangium aridum]|uniref:hypothetical protein n=1 Tax=Kibdelosporangium aridum TaxID=2030 RepID=UPI001359EE11
MDGTVQFWDLVKLLTGGWEPVTGHTNWVSAVAMTEWHGHLTEVTGGRDHTVRTWDLKNRRCLDGLIMPDRVRCLTLGPAGTLIVGFGFDIATFDTSTPVTAPRTPTTSVTSLPSVPSWERRPPWWYRIVHR